MALKNIFVASADHRDISAAILRDGYAVVTDVLDADSRAAIDSDLLPYFEEAHSGHEDFMGHKTKRFGALICKSKAVREPIQHPTILSIAETILSPHCVNFHIHYTGVMRLEPGEKAQILHRDTGIFPFANPCPPLTVATMWAMSDFTVENGATRLVPGSHNWQDDRQARPEEIVQAEMPAGSVLIYTGNVIHGGGDNLSMLPRTGLAIHYGLGWLRQEENQFQAVPPEAARDLPDDLLRLMGYELGMRHLGFVDHIAPLDHLRGVTNPAHSDLTEGDMSRRHEAVKKMRVLTSD